MDDSRNAVKDDGKEESRPKSILNETIEWEFFNNTTNVGGKTIK